MRQSPSVDTESRVTQPVTDSRLPFPEPLQGGQMTEWIPIVSSAVGFAWRCSTALQRYQVSIRPATASRHGPASPTLFRFHGVSPVRTLDRACPRHVTPPLKPLQRPERASSAVKVVVCPWGRHRTVGPPENDGTFDTEVHRAGTRTGEGFHLDPITNTNTPNSSSWTTAQDDRAHQDRPHSHALLPLSPKGLWPSPPFPAPETTPPCCFHSAALPVT